MENLFERFQATAHRWADRPAVVMQGPAALETVSYRELVRLAEQVAGYLHQQGLRPGDRCALLADNHARWCAAYLGIWRAGGVAVPLDTALAAEQVATLLRDSGSQFLFTASRFGQTVGAAAEAYRELRHRVLLDVLTPADGFVGFDAILKAGPAPPAPLGRDDIAVILYTSGTTSDPKGVMLTHGNLLAEADGALAVITVTEEDCILGVLPLFHALAQLANFLLPFTVGATVVFLEQVHTTEILRAFRQRGITVFCCVPQFFYLIHQRVLEETRKQGRARRTVFRALLRTSSLLRDTLGVNLGRWLFRRVHQVLGEKMRLLVSGGSRFDPAIGRDLHGLGFNILQGYGLTESSGAATLTPPRDNRIGSVGRPLAGVEVKVLSPEPGAASPTEGEVAIRGPIVMSGYYNRPDATGAALADGWLKTGDLGYLDRDGHLYITGRKKEVIVLSSGKNIYPEEIEAHYQRSPYLKELCVLSRPSRRGEPLAERLHAVVVPDMEIMRQRKIVNLKEILRFEIESLSLELPSYKRILSYEIWPDELPRTTTRKLKRYQIEKEWAARVSRAAEAPEPRPWTPSELAWKKDPAVGGALVVIARAASRQPDQVHPSDNLELDLGLDSMERVELLVALEQSVARALPPDVAQQLYTVRELVDAIRTAPAAAVTRTSGPARPLGTPWQEVLAVGGGPDPVLARLLRPTTLRAIPLFLLLRLFYLAARLLLRLRVEGRAQLPRTGAFLLCPNHESYLDVFLLVSVLPFRVFRRLFFVGASEYFETPFWRWLADQINVVPIDPDSNLVQAMQAGAFGLRQGKVLVLFPEGERSIDGELKTFKKGAAILSTHLQVPVVPVAVEGMFEVWPRGRLPQRLAPVRLKFGAPLAVPALPLSTASLQEAEENYLSLSQRLRERVAEMLREMGPQVVEAPATD